MKRPRERNRAQLLRIQQQEVKVTRNIVQATRRKDGTKYRAQSQKKEQQAHETSLHVLTVLTGWVREPQVPSMSLPCPFHAHISSAWLLASSTPCEWVGANQCIHRIVKRRCFCSGMGYGIFTMRFLAAGLARGGGVFFFGCVFESILATDQTKPTPLAHRATCRCQIKEVCIKSSR